MVRPIKVGKKGLLTKFAFGCSGKYYWKCSRCGSRYSNKHDAITCCGGELSLTQRMYSATC